MRAGAKTPQVTTMGVLFGLSLLCACGSTGNSDSDGEHRPKSGFKHSGLGHFASSDSDASIVEGIVVASWPQTNLRVVARRHPRPNISVHVIQTRIQELVSRSDSLRVRVVSTVHLADRRYWPKLEAVVDGAEVVFYEGLLSDGDRRTGQPKIRAGARTAWGTEVSDILRYRSAISELTDWTLQFDWERAVRGAHWQNADLELDQFLAILDDRELQTSSRDWSAILDPLDRLIAGETVAGVDRRHAGPPLQRHWISELETEIRSGAYEFSGSFRVAQHRREERAVEVIRATLAQRPVRSIAVLYGAAHTHRLVELLRSELDLSLGDQIWVDAAAAAFQRTDAFPALD